VCRGEAHILPFLDVPPMTRLVPPQRGAEGPLVLS
jgi:hypothetical protein